MGFPGNLPADVFHQAVSHPLRQFDPVHPRSGDDSLPGVRMLTYFTLFVSFFPFASGTGARLSFYFFLDHLCATEGAPYSFLMVLSSRDGTLFRV